MDSHLVKDPTMNERVDLVETLERIRLSTAKVSRKSRNMKDWLETLGLSSREYESVLTGRKDLPNSSLQRIFDRFKLTPEQVRSGQVDFRELALRFGNRAKALPERYGVAAFGRRRTTIYSLDYLEHEYHWRIRQDVMDQFGVGEDAFTDVMAPISMRFITEVVAYLKRKYQFSAQDFFEMGAYAQVRNQNSIISETLSRVSSPAQVYECLFGDLMKFFERNCDYSAFRLTQTKCVVHIASNPDIADALGVRHLGNDQICSLKSGWAAAATKHLGAKVPFAKVEKTACVHHGDSVCRLELDFEEAVRALEPAYAS